MRIPAIDGLRAIAFLTIFAFHVLTWFHPLGTLGVDLFFVISGFVITRSLMSGVTLREFYVRRVRRILPALLVLCAIMAVAALAGWKHAALNQVAAATFSYMNLALAFRLVDFGALGHAWSLSIEEQFYLLWPAAFLFISRRFAVPLLLALVVAVFAWRFTFTDDVRILYGFDTHCDGLALGCVLALTRASAPRWALAALFLLPIVLFTVDLPLPVTLAMATVASGLAVATAATHRVAFLEHPILLWIGSRSYSLYLWHYPIVFAVGDLGLMDRYRLPLITILTFATAELSFRLIERRFSHSLLLIPGIDKRREDSAIVSVANRNGRSVD